jgi:uncharacterized protein (DUF2336 family)
MTAELAFIREVENSIVGASAQRRNEMLRRVTDLFLSTVDDFGCEDLSIFDDVLIRLAAEIELTARALLARRLAPIRQAPPQTIRLLAFDDAIEVAGPVLTQSARLDDKTLVEIVRTKGPAHLLAISQRGSLNEIVTDALIEFGDRDVLLSTVDNYGASISDPAFSTLLQRAAGDDLLAEMVGSRPEIPSAVLSELIAQASQAVRAKLEASHPRAKAEVRRAVAEAAERVEASVRAASVDLSVAMASVDKLRRAGLLDEAALVTFAKSGAYAEMVVALAMLSNMPLAFVEQAMARDRSDILMVLAKAIGLSWATAQEILQLRADKGIIAHNEIYQRLARFERLQVATARDIVEIFRVRAQGKIPPAA